VRVQGAGLCKSKDKMAWFGAVVGAKQTKQGKGLVRVLI